MQDGLCRECRQVASSAPDDPLPARIARAVQRAGPAVPPRCPRCGSIWGSDGDFASCLLCGETFFRTSLRVLPQPRATARQQRDADALDGRKDRKR